MDAYMAAKAASDAAQMAGSSADAQMHRDEAQTQRDAAAAALADATHYAGLVSATAAGNRQEYLDLVAARDAAGVAAGEAQMAYDAAKAALDGAQTAVDDAQMAYDALVVAADLPGSEITTADLTTAAAELADAKTDLASTMAAHSAAMTANTAAQAAKMMADGTEDLAVAQAQRDAAQTQRDAAQAGRDDAQMYAGNVMTHAMAVTGIYAKEEERVALAGARTKAMEAAEAAEMAADEAEAKLAQIEKFVGNADAQYVNAQNAATRAREAATAARTASDNAQADATSAEAMAEQETAETKQTEAETELAAVQAAFDVALTRRINQGRNDVKVRGDNAKDNNSLAMQSVGMARTQSGNASDSLTKARSARTDAATAKTEADKAAAAVAAAEAAAADAAAQVAKADKALADAQAATTIEDLEAAEKAAADAEAASMTAAETAEAQYEAAKMAAMAAMEAADTHVVGLLRMANAVHITTAEDLNANPDETEIGLIEMNRLSHVAAVNTAVSMANADSPVAASPSTPFHGGGAVGGTDQAATPAATTTARYPYYASLGTDGAFGGTGDAADTGPGEGKPQISVNPEGGGEAVSLIHAGPGADGEAGTNDDVAANFVLGPGLGDFSHEKYFGANNDTNTDGVFDVGETRQRFILFTDIEQANAPADAITASVVNVSASASRIDTLGTANGLNYEDGEYDHDGNPDTATLTGDFTCTDPATCSITVQSGEVQSISGYTFTSDANEIIVPAVASEEDDTYLAFGIWLQETGVDGTNTYVFGAFADGGAAIGDTDEPAASTIDAVTGDATYTGKAAGVHSTATEVEFFHGDATLDAKFGDGTEGGTITGVIDNIEAGGESVTGSIELVVADPGAANPVDNIVDTAATFGGRARMGNTGMQDSSGEDIYTYTGGWSASFYNHMVDDDDTATIDESTRAPGSVAGTFGVGRADDNDTMDVDETESYVGAFGAHCSGTNCNPN